jgi:hypothetical protein
MNDEMMASWYAGILNEDGSFKNDNIFVDQILEDSVTASMYSHPKDQSGNFIQGDFKLQPVGEESPINLQPYLQKQIADLQGQVRSMSKLVNQQAELIKNLQRKYSELNIALDRKIDRRT